MNGVWFYALGSVLIVSIISLIGIFTLGLQEKQLKAFLLYFVSFAAGALFGDVFLHLLPDIVAQTGGFTLQASFLVLSGIVLSFIVEKIVHWRHCHYIDHNHGKKDPVHPFAVMSLLGDAVHNFLDGIVIGVSYLVSIPIGVATTLAVVFHEIPQEIGDFGVLLHGGFSRMKALMVNFLTALTAILGVIIALAIGSRIENITLYLVPFAAGGFIYIAGSDLIPELHKEVALHKSIVQFAFFLLGILVMLVLLLAG